LPANGFRRAPAYRARLARDVAERLFHVVDETLSSHQTPRAGSVFTYSMRLNIFGRRPTRRKDGVAAARIGDWTLHEASGNDRAAAAVGGG